jgi:hypothetical protein
MAARQRRVVWTDQAQQMLDDAGARRTLHRGGDPGGSMGLSFAGDNLGLALRGGRPDRSLRSLLGLGPPRRARQPSHHGSGRRCVGHRRPPLDHRFRLACWRIAAFTKSYSTLRAHLRRDVQRKSTRIGSLTPAGERQGATCGSPPNCVVDRTAVRMRSPRPVTASVDMTSTVKGHDDVRIARALLPSVEAALSASGTRAIGRDGARNCDG